MLPVSRLSLAHKGLLLFAVPFFAQLLFVALLLHFGNEREAEMEEEDAARETVAAANRMAGKAVDLHLTARGYLISGDPRALAEFTPTVAAIMTETRRFSASPTPESKRLLAAAARTIEVQREAYALLVAGRVEEARQTSMREIVPIMNELRIAQAAFVKDEERRIRVRHAGAVAASRTIERTVLAAAVVTLALLLAMGTAFVRNASHRLSIVLENTRRLGRDEPPDPPVGGDDEIADVDEAFHRMVDALAQRKRELEYAHGEMESFSYSVSHDLRAPLRAIGGYAQMLAEDDADRLDAEGLRYVQTIRAEASRMGHLIDDLLRFSRVSRQSLRIEPLNIAAMAEACLVELRREHPTRIIELRVDDLPRAAGDASLVRLVVMNLLSNAVKYTAPRPVAEIELTGTLRGNDCVYQVSDNGVGFDTRYADKLFAVFQRLHSPDEFDGTGVGLALVQRIVQRHHGEVSAASVLGTGATFTFTLPAAEAVRDAA
jgi:signal transduction histidine kinase